jgi:dephospho-CoA kinase
LERIIGLTGGIGTGKTTVANYLASRYQLPILDADVYAREAVQPGSPILNQIFERYGVAVKLPDGTLDRKHLGEIIFSYPDEKRWLEQQIHPYVRDRFQSELDTLVQEGIRQEAEGRRQEAEGRRQEAEGIRQEAEDRRKESLYDSYFRDAARVAPTAVLVIPLLFEAGMTDLVTEIWVVSCPLEQQFHRIMERDRLSPEQAQARINNQLPLPEKVARADIVLDNSSTPDALLKQVDLAL